MKKLTQRAAQLLRKLEQNKKIYEELDEITMKLASKGFRSDSKVALIDNFSRKNVAFRTTAVHRYQLELL